MMDERMSRQRVSLVFKTAIVWLCVFFLFGFLVATRSAADRITMSVIPEVPKEGEPIVATFGINNPSDVPSTTSYRFYVNGRLVKDGNTTIAPHESSEYQYAYKNALGRGEQVSFVLSTDSDSGNFEKVLSLPPYPPQLMSSFVSFAAYSNSVMSTMVSMEYFEDTFGAMAGINTGLEI